MTQEVSAEEASLGYTSPMIADMDPSVVLKNRIAYIDYHWSKDAIEKNSFYSANLTRDAIEDFEVAVINTATQFDSVDSVVLCVAGESDLILGLLTNEPTPPCKTP